MLLLVTLKAPTFPYNSGLSFCALMPVSLGLHCTSKLKLLIIASGGQKAGKKEGRGGGVLFFVLTSAHCHKHPGSLNRWMFGWRKQQFKSQPRGFRGRSDWLSTHACLMVWVLSWYRLSVKVFTERCLTLHHAPIALFGVVFFVFAYPLSCTLSVRTVKCAVCVHCYWWSLASPSGHCKIRWCSCQSCWLRFAKYACLQQVFPSA